MAHGVDCGGSTECAIPRSLRRSGARAWGNESVIASYSSWRSARARWQLSAVILRAAKAFPRNDGVVPSPTGGRLGGRFGDRDLEHTLAIESGDRIPWRRPEWTLTFSRISRIFLSGGLRPHPDRAAPSFSGCPCRSEPHRDVLRTGLPISVGGKIGHLNVRH
jgi:hypothetical protein